MKFQQLQKALSTIQVMKIESGHVHIGQDSLDATFDDEILAQFYDDGEIRIVNAELVKASDRKVEIRGKTSFPMLRVPDEGLSKSLLQGSTEVRVSIELVRDETLGLTLRYEMPQGWKFSDSFPDLGPTFAHRAQLSLDSFSLKVCNFHLTTHNHKLDDGSDVSLEQGLNFVGRWSPKGMPGLFEWLGKPGSGADKILHGPVVLSSADSLWDLPDERIPWDLRHQIRGIHLRADLSFGVSFPPIGKKVMELTNIGVRIYTPFSSFSPSALPGYEAAMTYVGELVIPSIDGKPLAVMKAVNRRNSNEQLVIAGEFDGLNIEKLSAALKNITGEEVSVSVLPGNSGNEGSAVSDFGLRSASITLLRSGNGYDVGSAQFTIGMGTDAKPWSPFGDTLRDLIQIDLESFKVAVVRPFDKKRRAVFGTIKGTAELFGSEGSKGLELDVQVEYPGFYISARQQGRQKVDLSYFKKQGMHLPTFLDGFEIEIDHITLAAEPGSYYSFSMQLSPGKTWKIGSKNPLPNLSLGVSCSTSKGGTYFDWQLEASAAEGEEAIPIVELIQHLDAFDVASPQNVPELLDHFRISAVRASFNTRNRNVRFGFDGDLVIHDNRVFGTVLLDYTHHEDGSTSSQFSGQIRVGEAGEELEFALVFARTADVTATHTNTLALAAYHDRYGQLSRIQDLVRIVSPGLAKEVPSNLTFALHDAVLGYRSTDGQSKWLFGLDIEGGINLSNVKLPSFPLLNSIAIPSEQSLKLAVQIVGATEQFTAEEVGAFHPLNPDATLLSNRAIGGLALTASLRLGQEIKQLSLPIGLDQSGTASGDGSNMLVHSSSSDITAATPHSSAQTVSDDGVQWMSVQKSIGSVYFERVGFAYSDNKLTGLLDSHLTAGGLTIALEGLSVQSPLTKFDPVFDLRGLGIDYRNGPLEIGGAFLKFIDSTTKETSFAGLVTLRTQQLSISGIGSYSLKDGHPSLFIYAVLDYPLGGPAFFFVTGLAAGFGYNRSLTIPNIDEVESFPIVQQSAVSSSQPTNRKNWKSPLPLPTDRKGQQELLTARLAALERHIPRAVGEHFLAIGLRFNSFKTIHSFALLILKIGKELEFDLLGLSTLDVPNVAHAQLALKATFNPDAGFLGVRAQLTPKSYVLSDACHLTGGSAFYSWFKDVKDGEVRKIAGGDFVLTLGGYHSSYTPPAHYPQVPRLGFNWRVDDYLQIKGDAYYAMTPQALMAGAHLEATWHKDQLRAWFTASADFLMLWKPYHYDARLYVDLGASYTFDLYGSHTITAEMGADLHLWGPPFSGEAHIHWWVVSFTVSFGDKEKPEGIKPITWDQFMSEFLPPADQVCGIAIQQGLMREMKAADGKNYWIVNPSDFVLVTNSVIPSTEAYRGTTKVEVQATAPAVRPAGLEKEKIQSTHTIRIENEANHPVEWDCRQVRKAVPSALWGTPEFDEFRLLSPPKINDKTPLIEETLAGFEIRPPRRRESRNVASFQPRSYSDNTERIPDSWWWEQWPQTNDPIMYGADAWSAAADNSDSSVFRARNVVLQALGFANNAK